MVLPKDIPNRVDWNNGNWARPDNVFCFIMTNDLEVLVTCTTARGDKHAGTDHVTIDTIPEFPVEWITPPETNNF